jgi:short-subunit dehydrogenase
MFSNGARRKGIRHLNGKVVVVTGAANGIGRALALQLWAKGCDLALIDLDVDALTGLQRELRETGCDQTITAHAADVGNRARMREVCSELAAVHGTVHVLINSAGIAHEAAFAQTSLDAWDRIVGANLWGVIHACHFLMPYLAKADRAQIVNISSMLGIVAMPGQTGYGTTKFAVRGFSEALAEELRATSVGLTLVYPGAVATSITKRGGGDDPELIEHITRWYDRNAMPPERVAARIIRAIEKGTPRLLIGPETFVGDWLRRLMPLAGNKVMVDAVIRLLGIEHMRARRIKRWNETMVEAAPGADREPAAR